MNIKDLIQREIILWSRPKDYLYSFLASTKKTVRQKKFDPRAKQAAIRLSNRIKNQCPGMGVYLFGSLGFEISGQNDIDLFLTGKKGMLEKYKNVICRMAGAPRKEKPSLVQWKFEYQGYTAELTLTTEDYKYFNEQKYLFEAIKNDVNLLDKYIRLKRRLNGKSERDYVIQRMLFFNQILAGRNNGVDLGEWSLVT